MSEDTPENTVWPEGSVTRRDGYHWRNNHTLRTKQGHIFYHGVGVLCEVIDAGKAALLADQAQLSGTPKNAPVYNAIDTFLTALNENPAMDQKTITDYIQRGTQQRVALRGAGLDYLSPRESMDIISNSRHKHTLGFYAEAILRIYSAAKKVQGTDAVSRLPSSACFAFCDNLESNKSLMAQLKTMAEVNTYVAMSVSNERRHGTLPTFAIQRPNFIVAKMRSLVNQFKNRAP